MCFKNGFFQIASIFYYFNGKQGLYQAVVELVTSHFMEESEYCDRMLIMSQSTSLAMGIPDEIRSLARSEDRPEPSIEDAFIALAEGKVTLERTVEESRGG